MRDNGFNVNVIDTSDDIYGMTPTGVSDCRKFKWSPSSEVWDSNTIMSVSAIYFQNLCAIKISSGLSSEYETDMKRRESSCRHVWEDHDDGSKWNHFPRYWPFVQGEFPAKRPVTRSFDLFFDLRLNKRLSKQLVRCMIQHNWTENDTDIEAGQYCDNELSCYNGNFPGEDE